MQFVVKSKLKKIIIWIILLPFLAGAQDTLVTSKYGVKLNSSFNGELFDIAPIPSFSYTFKKNQLEIGFLYSGILDRLSSSYGGQLNLKHFPNGFSEKFNLFFVASLNYINTSKEAFHPIYYNYWSILGGHGFQQKISKNWYLESDFRFGVLTFSRNQESTLPQQFQTTKIFSEFKLNYELQLNVGYRL